MARSLTIGLLVLALAAPAAAQGIGGQVVEDPYADFPRIVLDKPVPEPPTQPRTAPPFPAPHPVEPYPRAPLHTSPSPVTPGEALGRAIGQTLLRELDRALSGRGRRD